MSWSGVAASVTLDMPTRFDLATVAHKGADRSATFRRSLVYLSLMPLAFMGYFSYSLATHSGLTAVEKLSDVGGIALGVGLAAFLVAIARTSGSSPTALTIGTSEFVFEWPTGKRLVYEWSGRPFALVIHDYRDVRSGRATEPPVGSQVVVKLDLSDSDLAIVAELPRRVTAYLTPEAYSALLLNAKSKGARIDRVPGNPQIWPVVDGVRIRPSDSR